EVKSKPRPEDVDEHLERLEIIRQFKDRHGDRRKVRGALAGAIMPESVRNYAIKKGLYAIVQTGDTVRIDIPEDFQPREW
ncbi:MAG: hypothetical protein LBQ61_10230, partial [Spirochaetales bacterium]|nr:hypothetical protein [Spirochaetales bacterium]